MHVLIVIVASVFVIGLFWPTVSTMVDVWAQSRTFAHGFLILPAWGYLIWCYRDRLAGLVPTPSHWGLVCLLAVGGGWLIGRLTEVSIVQQAAVMAMLPGLIWTVLGTEIFRALLFPMGLLVFAVPVGTSVEPWFQQFTAAFIVAGLHASRIPVQWEGNFLTLSSGTWEVAQDCGGLRYVLPGLALGYLFVGVMYRRWPRRLVFLLLCLASLILANGVRAYGSVLADHLAFANGADHRVFSYGIYGATILLLFWLGIRWREPSQPDEELRKVHAVNEGCPVRETVLAALGAVALLALAPLSSWFLQMWVFSRLSG
ncbi:MAG: exosortase [Nitrospirae bacterium]|nr:exosortase [Nitrospirota bacterium]